MINSEDLRLKVIGCSAENSIRDLMEYVFRVEWRVTRHSSKISGLENAVGSVEASIKDLRMDIEDLRDDLSFADDRVTTLEKLVNQVDEEGKGDAVSGVRSELAGLWNEITHELGKLPIAEHPNYLHSMANFIAGGDVARMRDLLDEVKDHVERFFHSMKEVR
jgi:regulator of replication initiation timing